jgi:hypothetical protein
MKKYILFLAILLAIKAKCQDYLEPENGILSTNKSSDGHYLVIKKYLTHDLSNRSTARVIVMPAFSPEYIVSVEQDSIGYFIFFRTYSKSISNEYNNTKSMDNALEVEYKNRIDSTLADQLHELFYQTISQSRYPKTEYFTIPFGPKAGKKMRNHISHFDGDIYYFSAFENGIRSGTTWSPREGTKMAKLVHVARLMNAYSYNLNYKNELEISTINLLNEIDKN